jgi:hypothetical protein
VFVFVEIKYFVSQTRTLLKVYRYLALAAFWPPLLYSLSYWKSVVKQTIETAGVFVFFVYLTALYQLHCFSLLGGEVAKENIWTEAG